MLHILCEDLNIGCVLSCWLAPPLNRRFGRKWTIWLTCFVSAVTCIWQALPNTWWHMFVARFCLGFGIGPKSATVPIMAVECAPKEIRGALGMQWQVWTAFGIMLGFVVDLAFYAIPDVAGIVGLNWRLMMGSACFFAIVVCFLIPWVPESPRYIPANAFLRADQSS